VNGSELHLGCSRPLAINPNVPEIVGIPLVMIILSITPVRCKQVMVVTSKTALGGSLWALSGI
jgi:hypothetical protein